MKKSDERKKKRVSYYPFGLLQKSAGGNVVNGREHHYGFNGKEENYFGGELLDLDFGARLYDPTIGRWMVIDPLSEEMRRHSPYNYAFDNPVYFIDPDGMKPFGGINAKAKKKSLGNGAARLRAASAKKCQCRDINAIYAKAFKKLSSMFNRGRTTISGSAKDNSEAPQANKADRTKEEGDIDVTKMNIPIGGGASPKINSLKDIKKTKGLFTAIDKLDKAADITKETVEQVQENNKDTTVTATFAGGIETVIREEGEVFTISSEKDSTATMKKGDVQDFNQEANESIQKQKAELDEIHDL